MSSFIETQFEPASQRYVVGLHSAQDRLFRAWFDSTQFDVRVRQLKEQLAEDGWQLEKSGPLDGDLPGHEH